MSWDEANDFCRKITTRLRAAQLIKADEVIRLPSESEWEYCCRAGTTTTYSFGDAAQDKGDAGPKATLLEAYGWHTGNAAGNDPAVGVLKPNPWGLYDMYGNVAEWCLDAYRPDAYAQLPTDQPTLAPYEPDWATSMHEAFQMRPEEVLDGSRRVFPEAQARTGGHQFRVRVGCPPGAYADLAILKQAAGVGDGEGRG